ncbi:S8 family serine peptidase [Paenibacillus humicola]|uniref:S8 family serine peptidase n=1 Tax=Paenibacillus humicola TaxID=3110540 RepID=UPI00237BEEFF|nr:S8 family serine peptidase [Paenibacillus humicola]
MNESQTPPNDNYIYAPDEASASGGTQSRAGEKKRSRAARRRAAYLTAKSSLAALLLWGAFAAQASPAMHAAGRDAALSQAAPAAEDAAAVKPAPPQGASAAGQEARAARLGHGGAGSSPAPHDSRPGQTAAGAPSAARAAAPPDDTAKPAGWLVKWRGASKAGPLAGTRVLRRLALPDGAVDVVRPGPQETDTAAWLSRLRKTPGVEYVQPNSRVAVLAAPAANDPALPKQRYLDQIGAKEAWATVNGQTQLTIALVDTGVDLDHPDLKDNLVAGTNLVEPGTPPNDDNGHGTEVAGVLAAAGNNKAGVAGILWRAKIMPVKALDAEGFGDEERLGEAILYAVKNGAKIVVLSVGLYRYSAYLADIADYAESKGVLLVAACGNDGESLGAKADVKYPAAYPTVLAVGGATPGDKPEPRSNKGPELDLVAPWTVYTTAVGGGYKTDEGTSMSAPQAAAAAALVWAVHPGYKPYQVRALLRQSAQDIGSPGFDEASGYGLLRIDRAVKQALKPDGFEPDDTRSAGKLFPLGSEIAAQLTGGADTDWFRLNAPFDGVLSLKFQGLVPGNDSMPPVQLSLYSDGQASGVPKTVKLSSGTVEWHVKKGRNDLQLRFYDRQVKTVMPVLLTSSFTMAADPYENNDKPYEAYSLSPVSQTVTGNFSKKGDEDWFAVRFVNGGTVQLTVTTDTARIDPAITIQHAGTPQEDIDSGGEGETEVSPMISVTPGTYYFEVRNAASANAEPVIGEYHFKLDYRTKYTDPNEPNNRAYEATDLNPGSVYSGVIGTKDDSDWYQFRVTEKSGVTVKVSGIPQGIAMKAELLDKTGKPVAAFQSSPGSGEIAGEQLLDAGVYYAKLTSDAPFDKMMYRLRIGLEPLVAGFLDIGGHWAEAPIAELAGRGIVSGGGSYRFNPDRGITRAEASAMLVKAFEPEADGTVRFSDVSPGHWGYRAITRAVQARYMAGYPDGSFRPDQGLTREEMANLLARALGLSLGRPAASPYRDVPAARWSAPAIALLKEKGIAGGYPNSLFLPGQDASRAEFASALLRALNAGR